MIIIFAVLSLILVKRLVSPERVREELLAYLSLKIGGTVEFRSVEVNFIPGPHVVLSGGMFSVPGKAEGSFETVIAYPKVLPLLRGEVEIARLRVLKPEIKVLVHEPPDGEDQNTEEPFSIGILRDDIKGVIDNLASHGKGLNAEIENGTLILEKDSAPVLNFSGMNALLTLPADRLNVRIRSESNLWTFFNFAMSIDVRSYQGSGTLNVKGGKPHKFMDFYLPSDRIMSDSDVDLAVKFDTSGLNALRADISSSVPKLKLTGGDEEFDLSASGIEAGLYLDDAKQSLTLKSAKLLNPALDLSGEYAVDKASQEVSLSLLGKNVDVASVRKGALFIAGERKVTDSIFEVVRGGTVPQVTLEARGPSFTGLWKKGRFRIEGDMVNGGIYIPVAEFNIVEASGHAVIADGELRGTNLSGRLGNSRGHDGALVLGIDGREGPFTLDIMIDADPSQVPPVLEQFVHGPEFGREMRLIRNVKGTAQGRLILGEKKYATKAKVSVSSFDFTADYGRFPYPVHLKGGSFDYDNNKIDIADVGVAAGNSNSTVLSGTYGWAENGYFSVKASDTTVDLAEFMPWLSSFSSLKPGFGEIQSATGTAFFKNVEFSGSPSDPAGWKIAGEGNLKAVTLSLPGLSDPVTVTSADINSTPGRISVSNAGLSLKGSAVTAEMVLSDYLSGLLNLKLDFRGTIEPGTMNELSEYINLPESLVFKSPLTVKDSSIVYNKREEREIAGSSNPPAAPAGNSGGKLNLDVNVETDNLEWQDSAKDAQQAEKSPANEQWNSPVKGAVNVKSGNFIFKKLNWDSLDTVITFLDHGVDINVNSASLCGISTPGVLKIVPPGVSFNFKPATTEGQLASVIKCLLDKAGIISGDLVLKADISSDGSGKDIYSNLEGGVELSSKNGRVEKYGGLAKFFTMLNFGELFRGDGPEFDKEGFPYDKLTAKADIEQGQIKIKEAVMDGPSIKVVCEGLIDLVNRRLDLELLVIPVMAVDSVIEKIPVVNFLFGKNFVSIPIKITGDISNPDVTTISPTAVSFGLLGLIKQTLNIPVTIFKPVNRKGKPEETREADTTAPSPSRTEEPSARISE